MKIDNVLSIFDGMSCGQIALERAGRLKVNNYFASEIDKHAIKVTTTINPALYKSGLEMLTQVKGESLPKTFNLSNRKVSGARV